MKDFRDILGVAHPALPHLAGLLTSRATTLGSYWPPGTLSVTAATAEIARVLSDASDPGSSWQLNILVYHSRPMTAETDFSGLHTASLREAFEGAVSAARSEGGHLKERFETIEQHVFRLIESRGHPVVHLAARVKATQEFGIELRDRIERAARSTMSVKAMADGAALSIYYVDLGP